MRHTVIYDGGFVAKKKVHRGGCAVYIIPAEMWIEIGPVAWNLIGLHDRLEVEYQSRWFGLRRRVIGWRVVSSFGDRQPLPSWGSLTCDSVALAS